MVAEIEANHPNLINQKMLHVEIGRDRAELVTDDKAGLRERLEALTGEGIAALEALGRDMSNGTDQAVGRESEKAGVPESGPSRERDADVATIERARPAEKEMGL